MRNCPIDIRYGMEVREILRIRRPPAGRFPVHKAVAARSEAKLRLQTRIQAASEAVSRHLGPLIRSNRADVGRPRRKNNPEVTGPPLQETPHRSAERRPPVSRADPCLRFPGRI